MTPSKQDDRSSQLQGLLERVEAATGADRELDCRLDCLYFGWVYKRQTNKTEGTFGYIATEDGVTIRPSDPRPYTSSLDAALALVERALPGWCWQITSYAGSGAVANLWPNTERYFSHEGPTPALAAVAALLRALIAQADPTAPSREEGDHG